MTIRCVECLYQSYSFARGLFKALNIKLDSLWSDSTDHSESRVFDDLTDKPADPAQEDWKINWNQFFFWLRFKVCLHFLISSSSNMMLEKILWLFDIIWLWYYMIIWYYDMLFMFSTCGGIRTGVSTSFDSLLSRAGLGLLGKGWMFVEPPLKSVAAWPTAKHWPDLQLFITRTKLRAPACQ